jgi:hypothetical protein
MSKSTSFAIEPDANSPKSRDETRQDQYKRFIEAARELGADTSEEAFDRALRKVASAPPAPKHKPTSDKPTQSKGQK